MMMMREAPALILPPLETIHEVDTIETDENQIDMNGEESTEISNPVDKQAKRKKKIAKKGKSKTTKRSREDDSASESLD